MYLFDSKIYYRINTFYYYLLDFTENTVIGNKEIYMSLKRKTIKLNHHFYRRNPFNENIILTICGAKFFEFKRCAKEIFVRCIKTLNISVYH